MKNKKWSRKYSECIICGKNDRKHCTKGICARCYDLKRYHENSEKFLERKRKWKKANPEKYKKNYKKWIVANAEKCKKSYNKYRLKKYHTNIHFRLRYVMSSSINQKLKYRLSSKNGKRTWDFLPYTVDDLIKHLEKLFQPGMSWKNYGEWHIDHKKPDSLFEYSSIKDEKFQECWALKNLQPLWAIENIKKSNKIID